MVTVVTTGTCTERKEQHEKYEKFVGGNLFFSSLFIATKKKVKKMEVIKKR